MKTFDQWWVESRGRPPTDDLESVMFKIANEAWDACAESVKKAEVGHLDSIFAEERNVYPGVVFRMMIVPILSVYFAPRYIQIACFKADGERVAIPMERLPIRLKEAVIGCQIQTNANRIVGIQETNEEGEKEKELDEMSRTTHLRNCDGNPCECGLIPKDGGWIFRNMKPERVDWSIISVYGFAREARLEFENICACPVHVFVRHVGDNVDPLSNPINPTAPWRLKRI